MLGMVVALGAIRILHGIETAMGWESSFDPSTTLAALVRNLGQTLFLAQVGLTSGPKFLTTVQQTGMFFLLLGAAIVSANGQVIDDRGIGGGTRSVGSNMSWSHWAGSR